MGLKIPVIINNRNLLEWPRQMLHDIQKFDNVGDIIIVDNNSTYEPLLEWYATNPCEVIRLNENMNQSAPWLIGIPFDRKYEYYVVTDPDLDLSNVPKDCLNVLKEKLEKYKEFDRIGLSISTIPDIKEDKTLYYWVRGSLGHYWDKTALEDGLLKRHIIDTTFGLYHISRNKSGSSCSLDRPYSVRHLPWEITQHEMNNLKELNPEYYYYLQNAEYACSFKRFIDFDVAYKKD